MSLPRRGCIIDRFDFTQKIGLDHALGLREKGSKTISILQSPEFLPGSIVHPVKTEKKALQLL